MANYVLVYQGMGGMPETDEERAAVMAAWGAWYQGLGVAVVDAGNPFGPSATVAPGGSVAQGGTSGLTGYTILAADSLDAATAMAKGCPVLTDGINVEVYETFEAM